MSYESIDSAALNDNLSLLSSARRIVTVSYLSVPPMLATREFTKLVFLGTQQRLSLVFCQ